MKNLLIVRHAKSSWGNSYLSDHERPLNSRGKADAPRMGQLLKEMDLTPDLIISSTAKRAMATAKAVALSSGYENEIQFTRDFYHADSDTYLELLHTVSNENDCVMVVGHNPGVQELVTWFTDVNTHFTTANIAHVQLPIQSWQEMDEEVTGKLVNLWRPKEIG